MPSARAAALIRWIHSRRNAPLRSLRPAQAYVIEWSTCSLALRYIRDRWPRYPLARSSTTLRFLWAFIARFTRATSSTPWRRAGLLSQQLLDVLGVRGGEGHLASQPPGAPARLVLEQVLAVCATAHHLPGTGQPEAVVCSAVRLHLLHARRRLSLLPARRAALSCAPPGLRHAARCPSTSSADMLPPRLHPAAATATAGRPSGACLASV